MTGKAQQEFFWKTIYGQGVEIAEGKYEVDDSRGHHWYVGMTIISSQYRLVVSRILSQRYYEWDVWVKPQSE